MYRDTSLAHPAIARSGRLRGQLPHERDPSDVDANRHRLACRLRLVSGPQRDGPITTALSSATSSRAVVMRKSIATARQGQKRPIKICKNVNCMVL
jgi:hypothetical protein